MLWFNKKSKIQPKRVTKNARRHDRKWLTFESLEGRSVLAAGVINVQLAPFAPPGTALALIGDGSNNEVSISQTLNAGEYLIQGKNGTQLKLNNAGATLPSITVNGINTTISVSLGTGNDVFSFLARPDGQQSNVPADLVITNDDGSNINNIQSTLINGNLNVTKLVTSSGYSELNITSSTIVGTTTVNNVGNGAGDTKTVIDSSWLEGGTNPALTITNGIGADINNIRGNSQFGIGPFSNLTPVITISNGDGGSQTTFTGVSAVAGFGTTTVYGRVDVTNGTNVPGFVDLVTFDGTNVLGPVNVSNGDGNSSTGVTNSTLGSNLLLDNTNVPTIGGPLVVNNASGFDDFSMNTSTLPWGLVINNNIGVPSNWGSSTSITASFIGNSPYGPRLGVGQPGDAVLFTGDNGRDLFNLNSTQIGGRLDMQMFAGNNEVNLTNNSVMAGLSIVSQAGNDKVLIDKSRILVDVNVILGDGADEFYVRNIVFASDWPSSLLGAVNVDGGLGVDRTNLNTLMPSGFEILVP